MPAHDLRHTARSAGILLFRGFNLQSSGKSLLPHFFTSLGVWLAIAAISLIAAHLAYEWSEHRGYAELDAASTHQLDLYVAGLESELGKHEYLPGILELDPGLITLLEGRGDQTLAKTVNSRLASLNVRAGSLAIFAMDTKGIVRASSNWYQPGSFIGRDFSSMPYFSEAMQGVQARFFSPNMKLSSPEYHFAQPIRNGGATLGVAVVKISLAPIESTWAASISHSQNEKLLVIDEHDVIIISSVDEWKYKPTALLTSLLRAKLSRPDKRSADVIQTLSMIIERKLDHGNHLVRLPATNPASRNVRYVIQERFMVRPGWRLVTLTEASNVAVNARYTALGAGALVAFLGLLGQFLIQRRRAIANQLAARDALQKAHDELEHNVAERTAELRHANQELVHEVAERKRAEQILREAQDELVQASKLAVLGQMSAGITHEINQPLTALRSVTHNARLVLKRGQTERVDQYLESITGIAERMGRITQQLKSFSRKSPLTIEPVSLSSATENVLLLLENRIRSEKIVMQVDVPASLQALCDGNRLEQVLINLLANAFDAMKGLPSRSVAVTAWAANERAFMRIADSGPGIPEASMERLFEPFFSTKPPGEGLGLGLAISAGIVQEFGGTLRAENTGHGAAFEFDLKLSENDSNV